MVRPPKMAVLLLSVHPLLDKCLLYLHPIHMTDLPKYLPRPQLVTVLTLDQNISTMRAYQRGGEGHGPLLVSLVTDEPT